MDCKPRNLLQQIQNWNGPFRRLKQKQLGIDGILDGENLAEIGDLATKENEEMGNEIKGEAEFSGNFGNLRDVIIPTQEIRLKGCKAFRSRNSIEPLDSLESCVASQ